MRDLPLPILVADDSELVLAMVEEILAEQGYDPVLAHDGEEAWELFQQLTNPVAVITDLDMPRSSGLELTRRIRDTDSDVPVLVLSGNQQIEVAMQVLRIGADDYTFKGENFHATLVHTLERLLDTWRLRKNNERLARDLDQKNRQLQGFNQVLRATVQTLTRTANSLMSERDPVALLARIVSEAREITKADGATLFILRDNRLHYEIVQNGTLGVDLGGITGSPVGLEPLAMDRSCAAALSTLARQPVRYADLLEAEEASLLPPAEFSGTEGYLTRSLLALPMIDHADQVIGVLQLVNPLDPETGAIGEFSDDNIELAMALAAQASVSIVNARAYELIAHKTEAFERFVPVQFLEILGRTEIEEVALGDAAHGSLSVLFADIRSFTSISEDMDPEENFRFLNAYLKAISPVINGSGGFIDKYIGDAIMALFPGISVGIADDALAAAIGMHQALDRFNASYDALLDTTVRIGIGVNTGEVTLGTIGYEARMDTTVIGDTVNVAARMEGLTKQYGARIIATSATVDALERPDHFLLRRLDRVQVRGKEHPVTIWEVFDCDPRRQAKQETLSTFYDGLAAFEQGELDRAARFFGAVLDFDPQDEVAQRYAQRCIR